MSSQVEISKYINNLPLKKHFCRGYRPDDVYDVICNLSSMYNQVLSEAYKEVEQLENQLEFLGTKYGALVYLPGKDKPIDDSLERKDQRTETLEKKENDKEISMTDKELQKLKRGELLEMLLEQSKECQELKIKVEKLENQLASRTIEIDEAGNIAEASIRINGVFEAAQEAANQYLDNLKMMTTRQQNICEQKERDTDIKMNQLLSETQASCEKREREVSTRLAAEEQAVRERCAHMKEETKQNCDELNAATKAACEELERTTKEQCEALVKKAEQDVELRWQNLSTRLEEFYKAHEGLRELLTATGGIQRV